METLFPRLCGKSEGGSSQLPELVIPLFDDDIKGYDLISEIAAEIRTKIDEETCPNCDGKNCLDEGDIIECTACGHIVGRIYNSGAEYRFFSSDDRGNDPTRVGAPQDPSLPQASLGTVILGGSNGKSAKTMFKIRKYHTWNTVPYKERALIQAQERLNLIGLNYGINASAIDSTRSMYIVLQDIGGRQGLSRDSLLAGSLYLVLKESGSPRKPKEIAEYFGLTSAQFTKALKQMQEVMAIARQRGLLATGKDKMQTSTRATEYIDLPLSKLQLSRAQMEQFGILCRRVAEIAESEGLGQENMPPSLAAGCIAFVFKRCNEEVDIDITKIAEVAEISVATLQKCVRRLEGAGDLIAKSVGLS